MNIRFYNARILTMVDGEEIIENGELHVRGDRITSIGEIEPGERRTKQWDREIDVKGNLLMPGFKNVHTHSAMTFLRSHADDMKLQEWLTEAIFPYEAKLTKDDVYDCTKLAVLEYLTSGITSVCDMYLNNQATADAMIDTGMRCVLCGSISGNSDEDVKVNSLREDFEKFNKEDSLVSFALGVHAEYTCSKTLLEKTAELANELKKPVFLHCSETAREVEECKGRYGVTPPVFLDSLGLFNHGGAFFHGVHVTDEDIETANLIGMANNGLAEVNSKVKTNLPLCTEANLTEDYWALKGTWFLRLMEPYVSFAIMANDGDTVRQEHYQRFLDALNDFKNNGLGDIADVYPEGDEHAGEATDFAGRSGKKAIIEASERYIWW